MNATITASTYLDEIDDLGDFLAGANSERYGYGIEEHLPMDDPAVERLVSQGIGDHVTSPPESTTVGDVVRTIVEHAHAA